MSKDYIDNDFEEDNICNENFYDFDERSNLNISKENNINFEVNICDENLKDPSYYDEFYLERIDEVEEILEEICESIPTYAYENLNGGIILTEEKKYHDESTKEDLLIMGEYQRSVIGRLIKIYYGSFMEMYRYASREILKEKLEEVLLHEFTHHLEFLANEWKLVIEDNKFIEEYRKRKDNE